MEGVIFENIRKEKKNLNLNILPEFAEERLI
jgi:hypothetical protein